MLATQWRKAMSFYIDVESAYWLLRKHNLPVTRGDLSIGPLCVSVEDAGLAYDVDVLFAWASEHLRKPIKADIEIRVLS